MQIAAQGQGFPADTKVVQSQDTPPGAASTRKARSTETHKYVITLYPLVIGSEIEKYRTNSSDGLLHSSHEYLVGYIAYLLAHELCHREDHEAGTSGQPHTGADINDFLSCEHIAIANQVAASICDRVEEINSQLNDPNV